MHPEKKLIRTPWAFFEFASAFFLPVATWYISYAAFPAAAKHAHAQQSAAWGGGTLRGGMAGWANPWLATYWGDSLRRRLRCAIILPITPTHVDAARPHAPHMWVQRAHMPSALAQHPKPVLPGCM
eukprot:354492-Chlamydomonas_euryale.AAC.1